MDLLTKITEVRSGLDVHRAEGRTVGLVPTMGYLHAGHASLMTAAVGDNDITIASIFVNPLQFGEGEDLDSYPRDLDRDLEICRAEGIDMVFAPSVEEMYPRPVDTVVTVPTVSAPLEGLARPYHFSGVATVVAKLFSIVGPCRAYFGAKDWQQLAVIRRMAVDLSMPVEVVDCPIVREPDGLALSSRNFYLTADERAQAPVIRRALDLGIELVVDGETNPKVIESAMATEVATAPLGELDYAAAVPAETLVADSVLAGEVRLLLAVRFGKARLIDNDGAFIREV